MSITQEQDLQESYKFKDLKIYASTEWLAGNRKKYRQVFERNTTNYIYAELSLINKSYDLEAWEIDVSLRCFKLEPEKKEVCNLNIQRTISKYDHVAYIREGWGQQEDGSFWQKGKYSWEAYVNDRKVATKYFYIEDLSSVLEETLHEAVSVKRVEYFEGNYDQNSEEGARSYYIEFPDYETRYIFVELTVENLITDRDWFKEIFIRFYNDARELKGEVVRLQKMKKDEEEIQITAGWGSNVKGSWRRGRYSVEVVFQDKLIAESSFLIGAEFKEGVAEVQAPTHTQDPKKQDQNPLLLSSQQAFGLLNQLVGLRNVKRQISEHTKYIKFLQLRRDRGYEEEEFTALHSVFTGNPGTGKTTVARLLGAIYHSMGLLEKGHVHEVDRVDLIGEYIGQTAPKVKEAFEKAKGGVLFIDEAYALARNNDDSKDFGREVIELLVKQMSHPSCDFMVVVAGYPQEMDAFIKSNPGLSSRFKYYYDFDDYDLEELIQILDIFCKRYNVSMTAASREELKSIIQEEFRLKDKSFGNARYVSQLLEKAKINMGIRLMNKTNREDISDNDLKEIKLQDVRKVKSGRGSKWQEIAINQKHLERALQKLDQLTGLTEVKEKVHQLVDIVRYRRSKAEPITGMMNMHLVLVGNPGTGKTTVARILAEIYKALGVLEKGHIVETDRQGLVAGYVGQTAIKTAKIIDEALGGVLFIDEAYALNKVGAHNDFGDEAVQVLLKKMEDHRGQFFTLVAGYPDEMDRFLSTNPGLSSRFDHTLHFPDFNEEELMSIAKSFARENGYRLSSDAIHMLSAQLTLEYQQRSKTFGNARRVRQYLDEIVKQQSLRLGKEQPDVSGRYNALIKKVDVAEAVKAMDKSYKYRRGTIGF